VGGFREADDKATLLHVVRIGQGGGGRGGVHGSGWRRERRCTWVRVEEGEEGV